MGYSENVIRGFSWHALLRYSSIGLSVGKSLIIARILSPEDIGLFALVAIVLGVSEAMTETGVNTTIIQSPHSVRYFLDTAWVIAIVRGVGIGVLMLSLGLLLSKFFELPELIYLTAGISFIPLIKGFINPAIVSLHKNLHFFYDSAYRFALVFTEVIATVICTLWLQTVWGIVLGFLISAVVEVLISFIFFTDKPRFQYSGERGKIILQGAKGFSVMSGATFILENVDDFLVGKTIGTYNLGLYHWGYRLGHMSNHDLGKALTHSTLPIFSKMKNNRQRLWQAYKRSLVWLIGLTLTASIPVLLGAQPLITWLLTPEWLGIIPVLPWIIGAGILQAVTSLTYNVFLALEKRAPITIHQLSSISVLIPCIIIGSLWYGVVGAGVALLLSRLITLPLLVYLVKKIL